MNIDSQRNPYLVSIHEISESPDAFAFGFMPKRLQQWRGFNESPKRAPEYRVLVRGAGDDRTFDWGGTTDVPDETRATLETEVRERLEARRLWIDKIERLVALVECWTQDHGWKTRRIEKRLDDSYIGKHRVPALLMQEGTTQALLEPVGRDAPGTEGVVDLYLLPAYDDIATLYFEGGGWNVHHRVKDDEKTGSTRETMGVPLSSDSLIRVLEGMRADAAQA